MEDAGRLTRLRLGSRGLARLALRQETLLEAGAQPTGGLLGAERCMLLTLPPRGSLLGHHELQHGGLLGLSSLLRSLISLGTVRTDGLRLGRGLERSVGGGFVGEHLDQGMVPRLAGARLEESRHHSLGVHRTRLKERPGRLNDSLPSLSVVGCREAEAT